MGEADFEIDGAIVRLPVDALSLRRRRRRARYAVLDRSAVYFPPTRSNDAMVAYYSAVATLVELRSTRQRQGRAA